MSSRKKIPAIKVVFDTNALYTREASDLFKKESGRNDIGITWHFPDVVIKERQYQMQIEVDKFLLPVGKLEKLLGHNLNITKNIIERSIGDRISDYLSEYEINVLEMDESKVDWKDMIHRACMRQSPFSPGESEKGFRDTVIAEIFFQFIEVSPKPSNNCRVIFITNDDGLKNHIEDKIQKWIFNGYRHPK